MPNIQDLLALRQGGGPPPPQGGPAPGGAIKQVLAGLLQDPVARKGMQDYMMKMGGGAPMMKAPGAPQGGPPPMPMDQPPPMATGDTGGPDMAPGNEQDMVSKQIDKAGATWDGVDAPTQNDIERLMAEPTPVNIKSFDDQFGEGSAEQYLQEEKGEAPQKGQGPTQAPPDDKASGAQY